LDEATRAKDLAESDSKAKDARIKEMAARIDDAKATSERAAATAALTQTPETPVFRGPASIPAPDLANAPPAA
jgi:hypothetical protein